jgi:hypothetical protein
MVSLNVGGFWWLPGHEDAKVPGFLTYDPETGGVLNIIGALTDIMDFAPRSPIKGGGEKIEFNEDAFEAAGRYDRILGTAEGKSYTLEDCFESHRSGPMFFGMGSTHHQIVQINRIFTGVHFEENEIAGGNYVILHLNGLTQWVARTGVDGTRHFNVAQGEPKFTLAAKQLPDDGVDVPEFGKLVLRHHIDLDVETPSHVIEQEFFFGLDFTNVTAADGLLDVVSDIQDLVSIGTGHTAAYRRLTLFHPDLSRTLPDGRGTIDDPIDFLARWSATSDSGDRSFKPHEMFFSLNDLGGMPGLRKWLTVAQKHRVTLGRVMATRYEKQMYVSDRYLNRVASLEAFDRTEREVEKTSLNKRLTACAKLAGPPIEKLVPDVGEWIKILVRDRNDIAHELGKRQRTERVQWLYLAESSYWLYVFCILRLASAPDPVFDRIVDSQSYIFLQSRIARLFSVA